LVKKLDPICLSLEEVSVHADHKVSVEVDDTSALIFCDLPGILGQHFMPHLWHVL
jgi:hypothetical protein